MKLRSALKPSTKVLVFAYQTKTGARAARWTIRLAFRLAGASVLTLGHAGCAHGVDLDPETLPSNSSAAGGGPNGASLQGDAGDIGSFPPGGMIGSCTPTQWRVSASNSAPVDPPMNAIDGNSTTRWSTGTGQSGGQYYQIDFGGYVRLSQIVLDNTGSTGDHPRGYLVEISNDGINLSQQVIATGALPALPAVTIVTIAFSVRLVRYLRIEITGASSSWWSIAELHAMCQVP